MTFIEAISTTLQPRSQTAQAMQQRLQQGPVNAAPRAAPVHTEQAVAPSQAMESARLMMESRDAQHSNVPITGRTSLSSLSSGSLAAAYLTEMRLQQELADVQESMAK